MRDVFISQMPKNFPFVCGDCTIICPLWIMKLMGERYGLAIIIKFMKNKSEFEKFDSQLIIRLMIKKTIDWNNSIPENTLMHFERLFCSCFVNYSLTFGQSILIGWTFLGNCELFLDFISDHAKHKVTKYRTRNSCWETYDSSASFHDNMIFQEN